MSIDMAVEAKKPNPKNRAGNRDGGRQAGHLRLVYSSDWPDMRNVSPAAGQGRDLDRLANGRNWTIVLIALAALAGPVMVPALLWMM